MKFLHENEILYMHVNERLYENLVSVNEERKVNRNFLGLYRA